MRIIFLVLSAIQLVALPVHAATLSQSDRYLKHAYQQELTEISVQCSGVVARLLSDDDDGSPHQRFIIRLASGQTLLIIHNLDLATRIARLKLQDRVVVRGEYIWNQKGGLIYFTHDNPDGTQAGGFIRHRGVTYR